MKRKYGIVFGAVFSAVLMLLTVTAVPQVHSETIMNQIEEKELIDSELVKMHDTLMADNRLDIDFQQKLYLDPYEHDEEGFLNHIMSDEIIQIFNDFYYTIISDSVFQAFFNSNSVQQLIQTDEFVDFMNSDEIQYVFDNFNPTNQDLLEGQEVVDYILGFNVYEQYVSSCYMGENVVTIDEGSEDIFTSLSEIFSGDGETCEAILAILLMFIIGVILILLIGFITWIPAMIALVVLGPIVGVIVFVSWAELLMTLYPYPFPIISITLSFLVVLVGTIIAIGVVAFWPILCPIVIIFLASGNNPFEDY